MTALMYAAYYDHHAIVDKLVVARADLNAKSSLGGCALPLGPSGDLVGRRLCRLRLRRPGRRTALHFAAGDGGFKGSTKSAVALLVGGADRTVTNNQG